MAADIRADFDRDDAAALALELAWADRVAAPLRKAARALSVMLLAQAAKARANSSGQLSPQQQAQIRAAVDTALAALSVGVAGDVLRAVAAAETLALRQESAALRALGLDPGALRLPAVDPVLARAGDTAQASLARALSALRRAADSGALATAADLEALAARTLGPARAVESSVRWATNRAINDTARRAVQAAATLQPPPAPEVLRTPVSLQRPTVPNMFGEPPLSSNGRAPLIGSGLRVVWVAERNACLTCLALSGQVADPNAGGGFNEFASFSPHGAPPVWPPGMPLTSPPRHPHCRCRLRIITVDNTAVPDALRREAQRSVARGWSDYDSRRARLTAADRLVSRANRLPKTVNERARRDVRRGSFSRRHRPLAPHLRAD